MFVSYFYLILVCLLQKELEFQLLFTIAVVFIKGQLQDLREGGGGKITYLHAVGTLFNPSLIS